MKQFQKNDGFTLVELLVTLVAASIVTLAAASLLLLGTRIQYTGANDISEQQTVRIVLQLLEKMASSGEINGIITSDAGWELQNASEETVFEYNAADKTVYSTTNGKAELLTGLTGSEVAMEGNTLRFAFSTEQGRSYETAVYCRVGVTQSAGDDAENAVAQYAETDITHLEAKTRIAFLATLAGQYGGGNNPGLIINGDGSTGQYYSEWYIGGYNNNGWGPDTPWCACFLSWGAVKSGIVEKTSDFVFANVDTGMKAFKDNNAWSETKEATEIAPGDYIFFDWTGEKKDPAHVGVVLDVDVDSGWIYTIEGNSGNRVAVRRYAVDADVIMGYGILPFMD